MFTTKLLSVNLPDGNIPRILYAEDDHDDRLFLSEYLSQSDLNAEMVYVPDGNELIRYLEEADVTNPLPALIVLDLNMPRRDGKQTLKYLSGHEKFSSIPVIILSTSESGVDKEFCSRHGAINYFRKPSVFRGYGNIVETFSTYLKQ